MKAYTENIVQTINDYLLCDCITFNYSASEGLFSFDRSFKGSVSRARIEIEAGVEEFTVRAVFPLRVELGFGSDDLRKFFGMINHYSTAAVFEMDSDNALISCRCWCCCAGLAAPSEKMVKVALDYVTEACEKYGDSIIKVLFSHYPPELAIRACTGSEDGENAASECGARPWPPFHGDFDPFGDMDLYEEFEEEPSERKSSGFDLNSIVRKLQKGRGRNRSRRL